MVKEHPVVRNQNHGAAKVFDNGFELFDGGNIQMVGRLVQKQNIRFADKGFGQCRFATFAAGGFLRVDTAVDTEFFKPDVGQIGIAAFGLGQAGDNGVFKTGIR